MPAALALILGVASLELARSAQLPSASKVCVQNNGGFVMSFELWNTADNMLSRRSPDYSSGTNCLDLWTLGSIEANTPVVVLVRAAGGISHSLPSLLYSPATDGSEGATASFACAGSTKSFSCSRNGEKQDDQPGAIVEHAAARKQVSAKGVCVQNGGGFRMSVRLWDTATGTVGAWSSGFDKGGNVCVDGGSLGGVASGHPLVLQVSPQGAHPASFRSVLYDADAASSALFSCTGRTAQYECSMQTLVGQGASRRLRGVYV